MSSQKRIYQIDLFRFLAALAVVFFHYLFRGYAADNMTTLNFSEVGDYFKYGYLGVDLFFIISGFVIALSIKQNSLVKFIISRVSRLYPIYWVSVILTFLVTLWFGAPRFFVDFKQLLFNLTMFQNYVGVKPIDSAYWSLFVEMKFYIFFIGSYLTVYKIKKVKLEYFVLFWILLTIAYIFYSDSSILRLLDYFFILTWSSYFIAGIVFYKIFTDQLKAKYLVVLSICLSISLYHAIIRIEELEQIFSTSFSPIIISGSIISFYLLMLLVSTGNLKIINSPKLLKIGVLTYPLYLLHQNIGFIIFNTLAPYMNKYAIAGLTISGMLVISYLLSEKYEKHVGPFLKHTLESINIKNIFNLKKNAVSNHH